MQKHLKNLANILNKQIKKYRLIIAYLEIDTEVSANNYGTIKLDTYKDPFENMTIKEVRDINTKTYELLRSYLEKK